MSAVEHREALAASPPLATPAGPHAERRAAALARAVEVAPHLAVLSMSAVPRLPVRVTCSQNIRTLAPTRPFRVEGPWELQWEATGGFFSVMLNRVGDDTGRAMPNILANQTANGPGSSYVPRGGEYYLTVNAMGRWTMRVVRVE